MTQDSPNLVVHDRPERRRRPQEPIGAIVMHDYEAEDKMGRTQIADRREH